MTVRLRSLRVSAEMDTSNFSAGARNVESDVKRLKGSLAEFGASMAANDAAVTRLPPGMARLSRTYLDGYASASRFDQALRAIDKSLGEGGAGYMDRAVIMVAELEKQYGRTANAADLMKLKLVAAAQAVEQSHAAQARVALDSGLNLGGGSNSDMARQYREAMAAQAGFAAEAQRLSDTLRPLDALQREHNETLARYAEMARVGSITGSDLALATQMQNRNFEVARDRLSKFGDASKLSSHEMSNLGAQFQDIAVMVAAGQSPFLTIMQQGMQIVPVLGDQGVGGAVKRLGAGLMGFATNPLNLFVLGMAGAAWGAQYAFSAIGDNSDATKKKLEEQAKFVDQLRDRYREMGRQATESMPDISTLTFRVSFNLDLAKRQITKEMNSIWSEIRPLQSFEREGLGGAIFGFGRSEFKPFLDVIKEMRDGASGGALDFTDLTRRIVAVADARPRRQARCLEC